MQKEQLVITNKTDNQNLNFQVKPVPSVIKQNEISKYQTRNFLNNYVQDEQWSVKPGAFGSVKKFILKSGLIPNENMPKFVARKVVRVRNEPERFEIEREIQAYLNIKKLSQQSQHVVRYYGWRQEDEDTYHIYIQFCDGGNLQDMMNKKKKFSSAEIINIFNQLLSALLYLQSTPDPIAHRDLKPANILFHQGILKLTDFGKAKLGEKKNEFQPSETQTCCLVGTKEWNAPELHYYKEHEEYDTNYNMFASDIYSLGFIISSLLKNEIMWQSIMVETEKSSKEIIDEICYYFSEGKRKKTNSPKKRLAGPFDVAIENIIKKQLDERKNPKELEDLSILLFQMLIFNPKRRINYIDLKKEAIKYKFIEKNEFNLFEYQMTINAQPKVFSKMIEDITLYNNEIENLKKHINSLEVQLEEIKLMKKQAVKPQVKKDDKKVISLCLENMKKLEETVKNGEELKKQLAKNSNLKFKVKIKSWKNENDGNEKFTDENDEIKRFNYEKIGTFWRIWKKRMFNESFYNQRMFIWTDSYWRKKFWNNESGEKQNQQTYWRFSCGNPCFIEEQDIQKAIGIVKKMQQETGYEFSSCLKVLHSNLWNYEKSKNDLLY